MPFDNFFLCVNHLLRSLCFLFLARPFAWLVLGIHVRNRERLPIKGPALLVANHNSHLDTLVLMSLFPLKTFSLVRPVAAADYFLRNRLMRWISRRIVGVVPIIRPQVPNLGGSEPIDPLEPVYQALSEGSILIYYPEGTRGEPEKMARFKSGIAHIAEHCPDVPIYPIFLHGLGKSLPKGEGVFVPFFCDVFIGEPMKWSGSKDGFISELESAVQALPDRAFLASWD
jgi:1-acyl-sn-glycerol-3-phosphate acyltransferase